MSRGIKSNKDIEELKLLVEEVLKKTSSMASDIQSIKESQEFISKQFDDLSKELENVKKCMEEKDKKINQLEQDVNYLNKELLKEIEKNDDLNQYGRRDNLELHGIPVQKNENTNEIVIGMIKHLNIELKSSDISISHRLPVKPNPAKEINDDEKTRKHPPIIVKFVRREVRNQIYSKRAYLRKVKDFGLEGMKNLFINENLTTKIKQLFGKANWLRKEKAYKYIWTNGGTIYVRKNEKSQPLKISKEDDLLKIR